MEMRSNKDKSNVVHFRKHHKPRINFVFKFGDNDLNIVSECDYKYSGLMLNEHITFEKAVDTLCDSTGRALGSVINKFKSIHKHRVLDDH